MRALFLAAVLAAMSASGEMMNARIRFEESDAIRATGHSLCLATEVVQASGDWLVLEPNEFSCFQPANPMAKVFAAEGAVSGCALQNMKELGWNFELAEDGEYEMWMRAWFPIAAGYNHMERMDDDPPFMSVDSADGNKIDKYGQLPGSAQMADKWLQPRMWHWFKNNTYTLKKGKHFLHFPPNGAWCGGCLLDRQVLVKKGSAVKAENATLANRKVARAASGVLTSRRIKTDRIAAWAFEATMDKGAGEIGLEYSYGGESWNSLMPGKTYKTSEGCGYLYIRVKMTAAVKGVPPLVYGYKFRIEKKEK